MKIQKVMVLTAVVAVLLGAAGLVSCQANMESAASGPQAPDFTLNDINGKSYNLSAETKGKVVILDFWATWCPPCRMEIPHFQELHEEYAGKGLVVLGVSLDQGGLSAVRPFVEQNGVTYPVLIGDRNVANAYGGIRGIPTTFILDRNGRIVEKYVGYRSKDVFEGVVKKLL